MADISPSTSTDGDTDDKNLRVIFDNTCFQLLYLFIFTWLYNFQL